MYLNQNLFFFFFNVLNIIWFLTIKPTFKPSKYFSIDKVFRNETLDATHLAEFHQIEGVIADYDITLGDLIGLFNEFFNKLGKWTFFKLVTRVAYLNPIFQLESHEFHYPKLIFL